MARKFYAYKFTGLKRVQANLNKEIMGIKGRTKAGLWQAALIIQRRSMELTPVDTTNLKGSAYTQVWALPGGFGAGAEIGYTAEYAEHVHEIQASHKGKGQWKFLETAMKEKAPEVVKIIQRHARV